MNDAVSSSSMSRQKKRPKRAFWLKQLHEWHWVSSAVSLVCLLLFTVTGITLNHAESIESEAVVQEAEATLPSQLLPLIAPDTKGDRKAPLPDPVAEWASDRFDMSAKGEAEWSDDEIYLPRPRPGGDGWMAISRIDGHVLVETSDRGWIAWLNDLHKGRNAGEVWKWFIDLFAVASLIFAITGLILLYLHGHRRPATWPLVAIGLIIPAIVTVVFVHG